MVTLAFGKARNIKARERDRELGLDATEWPGSEEPPGWTTGDRCLQRIIGQDEKAVPVALEETILRFPSAPLHGLQRLHEHHVSLKDSENFHSYRILRSADPDVANKPVKRIFLMHTGLNERDSMGLYYRLASNLVLKEEATACVVRPFPGHLTRFPFPGFAETPLDRYLWDGSHLFRQFLRFMIETQWFLSVLARGSSYRYASGANLLAEGEVIEHSRLDSGFLSAAMSTAWNDLHRESEQSLAETLKNQPRAPQVKDPPDPALFEAAISSLRDHLNLDRDYPPRTGDENGDVVGDPALHVIGYSLGGFTAQSVFMSWPFLIASCSTLLGGGALRQLAPSAFAHPEEWQTVLHSLRYELDDRMMSNDAGVRDDSVAGIELELFTFFKRTFYEVFQQDYQGSFQTRLAAFRKRMLFVVGGNDPVVRPESVLDSGPPGGINLLEIGGLGHFLDARSDGPEEEKQRSFWLPEMSSLLSRFADRAGSDQERERRVTPFTADMSKPARSEEAFDKELREGDESGSIFSVGRLAATELLAIGPDGALPGGTFERCLDDLLARVASNDPADEGVLFMLRNEIPTLLLHDSLIRERAGALYHDDPGIVRYCHGVDRRRTIVRDHIKQVCLVLPWNARRIMDNMDLHRGYPSQAESAGGQVLQRVDKETAWEACVKECNALTQGDGRESVRVFDGNPLLSDEPGQAIPEELRKVANRLAGHETLPRVASLPDCWVWISRDVLGVKSKEVLTVERAIREIARVVPEFWRGEEQDEVMLDELRSERIRIVTVSRARYNPRFRGRLIVTPNRARKMLVHVALCLALSESVANQNLSSVFE